MAVMTTGPAQIWITNTTSSTAGNVWANWNQAWTSIGTTTGAWIQWNSVYTFGAPVTYTEYQETEQERAERYDRVKVVADWERRRQEQEEAQERYRAKQEEASRHANELLLALLSDEQAVTWQEHHWFDVHGGRTGRRYRIRHGIVHNVNLMSEYADEAEVNYCAHPPGVPAEDVCLAQMFLLVTDEDAFLRVANARRLRPERPQLHAVPAAEDYAIHRVDAVTVHERPDLNVHAVA